MKTGLFSGIVSGFLSLSIPDLQNEPVLTPSVVVNVLWFLRLVPSLTSALYAILFQQWSRRYLELVQRRVAPQTRTHPGVHVQRHLDVQDVPSCQNNARAPTSFHLLFLRWSHRLCLEHPRHRRFLRSWLYFDFRRRLCRTDDVTVPVPQFSL